MNIMINNISNDNSINSNVLLIMNINDELLFY